MANKPCRTKDLSPEPPRKRLKIEEETEEKRSQLEQENQLNKRCEIKSLPKESLEDKLRRLEEETRQLRSQLEQQKQNVSRTTPQENTPKTLEKKKSLTSPEMYVKREGTVDHGKEFESAMCALYSLKLSINDDVLDFKMTTNNAECGDFDDIELDVTFRNGTKNTYLFQLKHKDKEETLERQFTQKSKKNKYYLPSYLDSISKLTTKKENSVFILYTNNSTNIRYGSQLKFEFGDLVVQDDFHLEHIDLLANPRTSIKNCVLQLLPESSNENQNLKRICEQFYLFTNQKNLKEVQTEVRSLLKQVLVGDIYDSFDYFMKKWWSGNYTLTKHDVIAKLTELSLSPYIEVISGNRSNDKSKLIEKAAMEFELTIVECTENNTIQNIWTTVEEKYDCGDLMKKYELSANHEAKILWFSDLSPIVVKVNESNEERVKSTINFLRRVLQNKRIVLVGNVKRNDFVKWRIFENLSDLNKELYDKMVNAFSVSLQGRQPISLKQLTDIDETIAQNITTKELLEMSQKEYLVIGEQKQKFSDLHIPRTVSAVRIDLAWILKYSTRNNCIIILNCGNEVEQKLQSRNINMAQLSRFLKEEQKKVQNLVLIAQDACTNVQFEKVCQKIPSSNVYAFQVFTDEECILLFSKGKKLSIEIKLICKEEKIFEYFCTNLNVFCAPPGMGKSTLLQVLSNICPQDCWSVYVNLIDHNHFLSSNPDEKEILKNFLHIDNTKSIDSKIQSILLHNRKIYIFLDGLDEVESKCVDIVLNFAKHISSDGVTVWMSFRENLRDKISNTLHVVPIEIDELSREQQKEYIEKKLNKKYETKEIEVIFNTMSESAHVTNSQELLGIPLQLFIMTETFLNNRTIYENLKEQNIFVLTKMYNLFFEGKIKFAREKIAADKHAYQLGQNSKELLLEPYEIPALRSCLNHNDFVKLKVETKRWKMFIAEIKENGDKNSIIKTITESDEAVFNHQTYAEYFACVWFKNNQEKVRLLKEQWFSERYQNLRLMFDIMVAEENPLHLAIIYKNVGQVKKYEYMGHREKDATGRYALHIACSYGVKFTKHIYDYSEYVSEPIWYIEIINNLLCHPPNVYEEDNLFQYHCIKYSIESKCLYPIEKLLEKNLINLNDLQMIIRDIYNLIDLDLLYVIKLNYVHLLNAIININPNVINEECHGKFPLLHAIQLLEDDAEVTKLLLDKCTDMNVQGTRGITAVQLSCQQGQIENVKKLLYRGSNIHLVDNFKWNALH